MTMIEADRQFAAGARPFPAFGPLGEMQQELLFEADHRIANHLSFVAGFVRLQAASLADRPHDPTGGEVQLVLQGILARLDAVARVHRLLAARGEQADIDLSQVLQDLCRPLASGACRHVELVEDFSPGCLVGADQCLPLAQLVAEVVTNSLKYGQALDGCGRLIAACRKDPAGTVLIEIADDGPGLPETFDPERDGGMGFRMIRTLAHRLGAALSIESGPEGLRVRVAVPMA